MDLGLAGKMSVTAADSGVLGAEAAPLGCSPERGTPP